MRTGIPTALVTLVRRQGARYSGTLVSVRFLTHEHDYRYAPVISKRQGGAVARNAVRRSIRGIMQRKKNTYPPGWYIIYYNETCSAYDYHAVESELDRIAASIARRSGTSSHRENGGPLPVMSS